MSELTNYIQTIAKTQLLEEKISKAMSQSDTTINSDIGNSAVQSERAIGIEDGTTSTGTTTNNTVTVVTGTGTNNTNTILALGYIPAAQDSSGNPNGTDLGNQSIANLSGGVSAATAAANQVAQANGILNSTIANNAAQQAAIQNAINTDMTSSVAGSNAGSTANTGGSNAYMVATNGKGNNVATGDDGDPILSGTQQSSQVTNSSASDIANYTLNYIDNLYNSPGVATADQISTGNYSKNYNPLQDKLNAVIGFDPNGNLSPATASLLAIKVQIGQNAGKYPTPTAKDAASADQGPWANANTPPSYLPPSYQAGYYWSGAASGSTTTFSQSIEAAMAAAQAYAATLIPGGATLMGLKNLFVTSTSTAYTLGEASTFASLFPSGVAFQFRFNYNSSGTISFVQVAGGLNKCPGTDPGTDPQHSMCFLGPPGLVTAPNWPKTGIVIATIQNGALTYNPYDSEVPAYLANQPRSSIIKLAAGDGVNVINTNTMEIQPAVNGGWLISVFNSSGTYQFANYYNTKGQLEVPQITSAAVSMYYPTK